MMTLSPSVTVIVPVYNVSAYIEKCARSIFSQTLDNIEIIFIDDCSTDNSIEIILQILRKYPHRKKQTRIMHMPKNVGLAAVRHYGILHATGSYVIHCDGDDWVDSDYYQTLYRSAVISNADIVVGQEVMELEDKSLPMKDGTLPFSGKELMRNWYKKSVGLFCHNKLVRRGLYTENDVYPWDGLNMWEDNGLFARLFYYADKVVQVESKSSYHYNRTNVGAMTSNYGVSQVEQMIEISRKLSVFFESKQDSMDFHKTIDAFKYLARINLISDSFRHYQVFLRTFLECRYISKELDHNAFSSKGKIRFYMVRLGLAPIFIIMFKLKKLITRL